MACTSPSDEYQVVWLPQSGFSAAQHQLQCEPMGIGLARSGGRYGIRVTAAQYQQVFQKLKPEGLFLSPGARQLWHCGPWPYGCDRKSLSKVFSEWKWQARPLQPAKPINGGLMWLIQSVESPPNTVYNMQHGQVMISKVDSAREGLTEARSVAGPQSTVELCASTSPQDPWLTKDPWQQALHKVPVTVAPSVVTNWQEMEDRVAQSVLQKLPQDRMEVDDTEDRLQMLEAQMQQLTTRQQSLESTVTEHHKQNTAQVSSLQAQMMSQMEVQGVQIARMFEDQMTKLETILSKKGRYEWRCGSCRSKTRPVASRCFRAPRLMMWLLMVANFFFGAECRVGEAKTPGPPDVSSPSTWTIGVCNPSGLQGKSILLAGINTDVIAVSETHLTKVSRSMLAASLKSHSNYHYVITGAPSAPRVVSSDAGHYTGVATIARVPTRALCANWPPDLFESGRIQVTASLVNDVWTTGATFYGYPQSKLHANALDKTNLALDFLVDHMTRVATGPRYMAGDWNHDLSQLRATQVLQNLGWREVQDLEFLRTGQSPQVTCKGSTRKDMLWLSPELVASFAGLSVDHNRFPDHSVLIAQFSVGAVYAMRFLWPTPHAVPWPDVPALSQPLDFAQGSPTECYKDLWKRKEELARQTLRDKWKQNMRGRGQQLTPQPRKGWAAPPKKGRSQDAQPFFHGYNVQHARWIKQLRRLQNYHRWAVVNFGHANTQTALHGLYLWKSVLQAPGFWPSFSHWWSQRWCVGFGDPVQVPVYPPDAPTALAFCEAFNCELRSLEVTLNAARRTAKTSLHQANPNLVYKDTRRPMPEPVTCLLDTTTAVVTEVDPDDAALEFTPERSFDPEKPVVVDGQAVTIIHATADKLYLSSLPKASAGSKLTQTQPVGSLPAIFQAFHEQWRKRWCRHDDIPHSHWQQLIDFARHHVPHEPVSPLHISPEMLRAEVASKKAHAATGLDGVSRLDVLQADPNQLASFCSMFTRAENSGDWPHQVLTGRVASLAKREGAESTNDYRPITVFSLLYRAYSGLQARALLHWCDQWAHPDIHGNRRQHQTSQLWRVLVSSIQMAHDQCIPLSGLTADIEKCFNCLPRWPVLATAVHAGTPQPVMHAWSGALATMTRCFKVRDSYSPGFVTSTGLAEGCALSCFGMLLMDDVMHRFVAAQYPKLRVLSFVDNWDFMTWDPDAACTQLDALLAFAKMADLTVDRKKTYAWSTDPAVRMKLRGHGLPVLPFAKDLGAHIAFTKQRTNKSATSRMEDLLDFWDQLKRSRAAYKAKLRAIRTVAWPRGLFAVESAPVSQSLWLTQRRRAVKALQMDKAGVNPLLLLGLVECHADPEFVAIVKTVAETRLQCPLDFWASEVFPAASGLLRSPASSPVSVLLERVQTLGFVVHPTGCWEDRIGLFHPGVLNFAELTHRLQWQWDSKVAADLSFRKDFGGLGMVDPTRTRAKLSTLAVEDQMLLRLSLAGGLFTQDAHSHWNDSAGVCKWCGTKDSLQHRYFECPHTEDLRLYHAPLVTTLRADLPDAMVLRSWALLPPTHFAWLRLLDSVPSVVPSLGVPLRPSGWSEVFTDGSCLWQSEPSCRVAAWGAILASSCNRTWNLTHDGVLGAGCLPGLCQTSYRAELYAVGFVLHHAAAGGFRVKIYSDCLGVINRYHQLTAGKVMLKCNSASSDLWAWILQSVDKLGAQHVQLLKTPAHKTIAQARDRKEAWLFWNNQEVDRLAKATNLARDAQFWTLWRQHRQNVLAANFLHDQVVALHVAVAKRSVHSDEAETLDEVMMPAGPCVSARVFPMKFDVGGWTGGIPPSLAQEYGGGLTRRLETWWRARTSAPTAGAVRWITFVHLYTDWQLAFGCPGPVKNGSVWLDAMTRPFLDAGKNSFLSRLKWFRRFLKMFWKTTGQTVALAQCRGEGEAIHSFVNAASIPWDYHAFTGAEHWLLTALGEPCRRGTKMLKQLPLVKAHRRYAISMGQDMPAGANSA